MAAISRAFAPPRSPISARSRSGCRSAKRRCWWRCRNRRKRAGWTASRCGARGARPRARPHGRGPAACPADEIALAKAEPVPTARRPMPMLAPHSADRAIADRRRMPVHRLTLDAGLQKNLEDAGARPPRAGATLAPISRVAIIAVDNASGDVLARVGSPDYFDDRRAGQVDMTAALRSPGSTLKPFIYGLGFEDGFVHPESLIDDRPIRFGGYAPQNFDMTFQGTVPVRKALQLSLNVPAIAVLDRVGASRLTARLKQAGANLVLPKDEVPGLAMGLGGVGITLADLVQLYAGHCAARHRRCRCASVWSCASTARGCAAADGSGRGLAGRQCADRHAAAGKRRARPDRVQDRHQLRLSRCLVGRLRRPHDDRRLGRPSRRRAGAGAGRPHRGGADPVRCLRAAADAVRAAAARASAGVLVTTSAKLPPPLRHFRARRSRRRHAGGSCISCFRPTARGSSCAPPTADRSRSRSRSAGGVAPLTILVNGMPAPAQSRGNVFFRPPGPGFARVTVIDGSGAADSVMLRFEDGAAAMAAAGPAVRSRRLRARHLVRDP